MGSVRLTAYHDDAGAPPAGCDPVCDRREADAVAGSFVELTAQLGY